MARVQDATIVVLADVETSDHEPGDRAPDADVIVDFTGRHRGRAVPLGVWSFGFGDGASVAAGACGTLARLYRLTADPDRAVVLHEGWFRGPSADSAGTRSVGDRVAFWCARVLERVVARDLDLLNATPQPTAGCSDPLPPPVGATGVEKLRDAVARWRRRERWTLGIVPMGIEAIVARGALPEPAWLRGQPGDRYYADPFPLAATDAGVRVLAEEYRYRTGRGRIAELLIAADGTLREAHERLASGHHLSYPFVLREKGRCFCVPESASAGHVGAFPIAEPADRLGAEEIVMDGFRAVDATLAQHDGRWWLFCTRHGDTNQTDLFVFSAAGWRGPWTSHPWNPVKSDARSSRPAGALFSIDGVLYRPAQDCSRRYGGAVSINKIVELSPTRFREHPVLTLAPSPSWAWPDGLHTINSLEGSRITLVDGLRVERFP